MVPPADTRNVEYREDGEIMAATDGRTNAVITDADDARDDAGDNHGNKDQEGGASAIKDGGHVATFGGGDAAYDGVDHPIDRVHVSGMIPNATVSNIGPPEPHQLLQARANSKRSLTALLRTIRRAVGDRVPGEQLEEMERGLSLLFTETMTLHRQYCAVTNRDGAAWETELEERLDELAQLKLLYGYGPSTMDCAQGSVENSREVARPDSELRRSARLRSAASTSANANAGTLNAAHGGAVHRRARDATAADADRPAGIDCATTDGGAAPGYSRRESDFVPDHATPTDSATFGKWNAVRPPTGDDASRHRGPDPILQGGGLVQPFETSKWKRGLPDLHDYGIGPRPTRPESVKSVDSRGSGRSSRVSHASIRSNASALAHQRMKVELELERLKAEEEEEAQLAELERSYAEARRELKDRRREREVQEAMTRLRLPDISPRAAMLRQASLRDYESEPDEYEVEDRQVIRQRARETWQTAGTRQDDWIDGLKLRANRRGRPSLF